MRRLTGAQILAESLAMQGVTHVFGLIGSHILPIYDALIDQPSIRNVVTRHELNAAVMADVYGRLTGRPGVCLVTAGPGATNSITGVAQAFAASSPLIHISGTVSSHEAFHAVGDGQLREIFSHVAKASLRIDSAQRIRSTIADAFTIALTGRKGPVHVEIPLRVQTEKISQLKAKRSRNNGRERPIVLKHDIDDVVSIIAKSIQPAIFAGPGIVGSSASSELVRFAERIMAPVIVSIDSLDVFPHDHPLFAGYLTGTYEGRYLNPVVNFVLRRADLLLLIGANTTSAEVQTIISLGAKKRVQISSEEGRDEAFETGLVGDIGAILHSMTLIIMPRESPVQVAFAHELRCRRGAMSESLSRLVSDHEDAKPIHPGFVAATVRRLSDKNAIITVDVGGHAIWMEDYFRGYMPLTYLRSGDYGSMGFALPAAIAAKIAKPDQQIIAVTGDGGFSMSMMELATAVENNLKMVVIVLNDSKYGVIWQMQRTRHKSRHTGVDLQSSNFAEVAKGLGAEGIRVEDSQELVASVRAAFSNEKVTVLDVVTDHTPDYASSTLFKRPTSDWRYLKSTLTRRSSRKAKATARSALIWLKRRV